MQIDQDSAAQQAVDRVLTRGVATHQPFQRGRLIGGVVVDVGGGVVIQARDDEIDQFLERALLARKGKLAIAIPRPERMVVPTVVQDAEQVVETILERVWISLDVEEQIAGRRLGQRRQASLRIYALTRGRDQQLVQ